MSKVKMTKSEKIRAELRARPGANLDALASYTGLARNFISSVCGQWVRKGLAAGSAAEGYTLLGDGDGKPPKVRGNRAAMRQVRRAQRKRVVLTPAGANAVRIAEGAHDWQVGGDHYVSLKIQPWDAMQAWMSPEAFEGFLTGNVIKYVARHKRKGGVEDLRKSRHYLDKLSEVAQ